MTKGLRYPPFAKPGTHTPQPVQAEELLPPIDDFLDELPSIDDFLASDEFVAEPVLDDYPPEPVAAAETEHGWAAGDWQSYDWSSISSLNRSTSSAVDSSDAWSELDWPDPVASTSRQTQSDHPSADEIADALSGMAHRIRSGELIIDNLHGTPPEAAMAAALAVLLRMRG
jgi:hypothetical protein